MKIAAIIPAAGQGKRLRAKKLKPFVLVAGVPILVHTIVNLKRSCRLEEIILVVPADQKGDFRKLLQRHRLNGIRMTVGGKTRAESVRNGFEQISDRCDWVLVHDAARPLVSRTVVNRLIKGAKKSGAAIVAMPITSTVKRVDSNNRHILRTENREALYFAQTPQFFQRSLLAEQYQKLGQKVLRATDEATLFDGSRIKVIVVPGEARNIKVTTPEDMELLKFYLRKK